MLARAVYQQNDEVIQLLRDVWSVGDTNLQPVRFDASARIEYASVQNTVALAGPRAFLAALSVNAPETILFLLRVFFSVGVIVSFMALLWQTVPDRTAPRRRL